MKYSTDYKSEKYYVGARFKTSHGYCRVRGKIFRKGKDPHYAVQFENTGTIVSAEGSNISRGVLKDLMLPTIYGKGYLGIGKHRSGSKGKPCKEYTLWIAMLNRCYGNYPKYSSYENVEVCERWRNYQSFCEDLPLVLNYDKWLKGGYSIDKDISGKDIYSPQTVIFITNTENSKERQQRKPVKIVARDTLGRITRTALA